MEPTDEDTAAPSGLDAAIARKAVFLSGLFHTLITPATRRANEHRRYELILGLAAQRHSLRAWRIGGKLDDLTEEEKAEILAKTQFELMDPPR